MKRRGRPYCSRLKLNGYIKDWSCKGFNIIKCELSQGNSIRRIRLGG